jgi:type II secretory pathway pseudopilin PulG
MMTKLGQEAFMFHYRHKLKTIKRFYIKISQTFLDVIKKKIIQFLRALLVNQKKQRSSVNAGFVLPTVAMVALVVVLMTTAILFRSFERAKHASNVRVNEAVLNAANPAIERAKAKIEQLFGDSKLESSIPSDFSLEQVINKNLNEFTFGDETQLKLVKEKETLQTVWKYPVDIDNNGKFDSYTLYGIYFRTPISNKARSVLEARTQPMDTGTVGTECQSFATTSGNLVSTYGWYKVGEKLKKSIFVYTTTVPITDLTKLNSNKYETFRGNKGFVALEYQQDRERIPLSNNAVVYEDDLEIAPTEGISLNGRILTNGNLLTTRLSNPIKFYLVSSPKSCYFKEGNSKIIVAGNVIDSRVTDNSSHDDVLVDLFNQQDPNNTIKSDVINNTNKTVPTSVYGNTAAYNDEAYAKRIDRLVQATNSAYPNNAELPEEVKQKIERYLADDSTLEPAKVRNKKLKIYFKKRTRRVPYAEIPQGSNPLKYGSHDYETNSPIQGIGNSLRPVDEWVFPFNPADGKSATNYAEIGIKDNGSKLYLPATEPVEQAKAEKEQNIGDRLLVGNNLPQLWYDTTKGKFLSSRDEGQIITGKEWDVDRKGNNSTVTRKRFSQAYQFEDLGATNRDEFWEKSAAQKPESSLDVVGGLRVVTGAGIYLSSRYTASGGSAQFANAIADSEIVWEDTNKNQDLPDDNTPLLRMRATAVYHYQDDSYNSKTPTDYQKPIACISSYYNPTNSTTARNQTGLPDVSLRNTNRNLTGLPNVSNNPGDSNNGVVYSAESLSIKGYENVLNYQAKLKYLNGRWVNKPLQNAWKKITTSKPLTLAEQSAVDSAICALKIFDRTIGNPTDAAIPHGAIMETAFLDAREIEKVESGKPLEIRATILDLDLLRRKSKNAGEFLFPNSGIIYATRDDALPDASASKSPDEDDNENEDISATDFNLDPTRRPNSIMLINGSDLSRHTTYNPKKPEENEKGLILISNLPVYIKGNFNVHTQEEFTDNSLKGEKDWSNKFYARQSPNPNFGCRKDQFPGCNTGETWRSAAVIADAITVLSNNFRFSFREESDYNSMQTATNTETNLIFAQGNTPGRPTESNGGLENFVRYLENWKGISHTVAGSFIQFKHSHYATAPWQTVINGSSTSNQNLNRSPFFTPPNRFWSYDTALLSQSPDLFSLHFTTPTTNKPNEFYREVGRDDAWVKTLLCAQETNGSYAISQDQRGTCP